MATAGFAGFTGSVAGLVGFTGWAADTGSAPTAMSIPARRAVVNGLFMKVILKFLYRRDGIVSAAQISTAVYYTTTAADFQASAAAPGLKPPAQDSML